MRAREKVLRAKLSEWELTRSTWPSTDLYSPSLSHSNTAFLSLSHSLLYTPTSTFFLPCTQNPKGDFASIFLFSVSTFTHLPLSRMAEEHGRQRGSQEWAGVPQTPSLRSEKVVFAPSLSHLHILISHTWIFRTRSLLIFSFRGKMRYYTYVITDETFRFSETGAPVGKDML